MITGKIGRYEIKSEIAKGGMSTVYLANDPNFGREVAIKVLPQAFLNDPKFRKRFEREGKLVARLEHPNIVPVYDFGEEAGQPYIVMRYMAGGSLTERLRDGALPLSEVVQIIAHLAPALDAAHANQFIHRDLKPGNILFDQYGNAYLSDFGIARIANPEGIDSGNLTGQLILGTPTYMSPEQIQGGRNLDGRSDLYALGVLLFQMLTGEHPYKADTPAQVMMAHLIDPIPSVLAANPDLPEGCEYVIARALAKEPDDRFATAGDLAAALERAARPGAEVGDWPPVETMPAPTRPAPKAPEAPPLPPPAPVGVQSAPQPLTAPSPPAVPANEAAPPRTSPLLAVALVVVALIILGGGVIGLAAAGRLGYGPFAFLLARPVEATPTATVAPLQEDVITQPPTRAPTASPTAPPPSRTPTLTFTPSPTATVTPIPPPPVIGGADKIAWLAQGEIWAANLDGSGLVQLTDDGIAKSSLQWSPDGKSLYYISGTCINTVEIDSGRVDFFLCFKYVEYFKDFEISPDGARIALSVDNQLYITPFETEKLRAVTKRSDLVALATCEGLTPYERNFVKFMRWSSDSQSIALIVMGVAADIGAADIVQVLPLQYCGKDRPLDHFPPPRLSIADYERAPMLLNFGWDGLYLFAFNTYLRNSGFGDLYIYNMDLHKGRMAINPVENTCCYRDPIFSPDGAYLLFAYQVNIKDSPTLFYLIPYNTLGTGAAYQPLPLPPILEQDAFPQAVLRTVQPIP